MSHFTRLKAVYDELNKKQLQIGFFEHGKYPDGTPIAYVAAIQELGHPAGGIPPRPFLRPAMAENAAGYKKLISQAVNAAVAGSITLNDGLNQIGTKAAGDVQNAIRTLTTPPLHTSTIRGRARRHSKGRALSKPLVDSGQMLQTVTYAVEGK
ncbi:hypothetical protein [Erwinia pyrifoliae]|uniref:Phage-related protein n=1 Tax=Erwinia pyrifoliae TaxID=79967 RepID=A0ABY5XCD5_ERWPY|nr:hypothetical protein [Erwinia pyrifoliae]AUX72751.1 hypothetical protein CPI84_09830 [Erwinia pyrifoliae]MCA8876986.1 hypothetical protein [Erwinia pyrifoliae]MCT2387138.1 hypothetical protein [Erwinia pyrifoliae]MCU8587262.1 hypothetical protein [Erwinia pyrifoliae]UWS31122.1 hypothetical protein NYP81_06630 [Erwinia pyrifoliae]